MNTKVLILRCGALGDLVYSTFIIDTLKQHFGNSCIIDFIAKPPFGDIFKFDNRVANIYELSQRQWPIILSKEKKNIIKISKEKKYDLFINFEYNKKFKTLAQKIYAKHKIGHFSDNLIYDDEFNTS
jgi:ADP-heptose:LPS heptosyltransferase